MLLAREKAAFPVAELVSEQRGGKGVSRSLGGGGVNAGRRWIRVVVGWNPPGRPRDAATGAIAAFGSLRRDARVLAGVGDGRDGWSQGYLRQATLVQGPWHEAADRGEAQGRLGLAGVPVAPRSTKPGRLRKARSPAKIGPGAPAPALGQPAGGRSLVGSGLPTPQQRGGLGPVPCPAAGPHVPPEGAVQIGGAGSGDPAGGVLPQPRRRGVVIPRCPVVTFRFESASQNVSTAPAGGPAWRRWPAKPGEVSRGRGYRAPCAGLGAGGRQCSPESRGDIGVIS